MDAFAPQSIRADRPGSRLAGAAGGAILALALGFSLVSVPGPPNASLDGSWQEMLVHARAHGFAFGRDLIFTWGPWGFLCSRFHLGRLEAVPILLWQTLGQFLLALALVFLTRRLAPWRRIAFAALLLAFHWLFLDTAYFVLMALIVVAGMMDADASPARLAGWAVALGFLAQFKFTYLVVASGGCAAAIACWWVRRSWGRAAAVAAAYAAALVGAWVAAGQSLDSLVPYLRRGLELSLGYGEAMGLDESWPAFLWGAGLALACAVFVGTAWRGMPDRARAAGACAYLALAFLVVWKEGFTRADLVPLGGHVLGFFAYVAVMAPVLPGLLLPGGRRHWFDLAAPACLLAVACIDRPYYALAPRVAWQRYCGNAAALGKLGALPEEWQRACADASAAHALPSVRAAVGDRTVDVYDFNAGIALLNGLRVAPRPVFQGYTAYTPGLEDSNLRHYQSGRAPDFLLWGDERIDERYPGQDDAMLVARLPGSFEPLFRDGGYWLFRRFAQVSALPAVRRLLFERTLRLAEEVELPPGRTRAIWLRADPVANDLGRLRAALYKPAAIEISTADLEGRRRLWRLVPRVARDGFILAPTLENGDEMASLLRGQAHGWVRSFHFEAPAGQEEFWSRVAIAVFELPGVALRLTAPPRRLAELGIFDRTPVSVSSAYDPEVFELPEGRAVLLHAESEVILEVPAGASRFAASYGVREGAYTGGGRTAGVGFAVDAVWPAGRRERLWSRQLDPLRCAGDRGTQSLGLAVPADAPVQLVVRMSPGAPGDNRWAWSYLASVRFERPPGP